MMLNRVITFLKAIYVERSIIYELAKRDFQQQYMGSYFGSVWVFLQPLLFILVLFAVFTLGFRKGASTDMPFSLYLVSGIIAWMFFSGSLGALTGVVIKHKFLVNRISFRLSILPIVKLLSGLVPHIFFIFLSIIIAWINGYAPSFYTFQVAYYLFAMFALLLGLGWITSSTSLFVKDVTKVVAIVIQFGFWLTPNFWSIARVPDQYLWIIKLNPLCYIVNGYRDSLVRQVPFWEYPLYTCYYWGVTCSILFIGITVFGRLRPHFAEVV